MRAQSAPPPSASAPPAPGQVDARKNDQENGNAPGEKRILGFIPNFISTDEPLSSFKPLTPGEKFKLAAQQSFDFSAHPGNLLKAAIGQARDGRPHYGQGWGAFGERFGAAEGDKISSTFFITGVLPALLRQDPRYFRRGSGSFHSRLWYSLTRTVVIRNDSGVNTFNSSQILGQLLAASASNIYYPPRDRGYSDTFEHWGVNLAFNTAYNAVREFYPDMLHAIAPRHFRRHPRSSQPGNAPAPAGP